MTAPVGKAPPKKIEKNKEEYQCYVILERTTREKADDKSFPTDAFLVRYVYEGQECLDVTRASKAVNVFDRYYDIYGPNSVKAIDYGPGTVSPGMWNLKPPERKKRKRRLKDND